MTPPEGKACRECEGRGFLWGTDGWPVPGARIVKRCTKCKRFESDQTAGKLIVEHSPDFWTWGTIRDPILKRVLTVVFERR